MKRSFLSAVSVLIVLLFAAGIVVVRAQGPAGEDTRRGFGVDLDIVLGTNSPGSDDRVPSGFQKALERTGKQYSFRNYRGISSQLQRILSGGQIQSETFLKKLGGLEVAERPIFTSWSLGGLENPSSGSGRVLFGSFRFSARMPAKIGDAVTYEKIRYVLRGVAVREGTPTIIGTLPVPQSDEMLFFVLTVKDSEI